MRLHKHRATTYDMTTRVCRRWFRLLLGLVLSLALGSAVFQADDGRPHQLRSLSAGSAARCIHHGRPTNGRLVNDSNLSDSGVGYYHFANTDPPNSDDWACPGWLISKVEVAGMLWGRHPRIGILDLSRMGGGYFGPHKSHQNGLDVDVRYVGTMQGGAYEGPIDFNNSHTSLFYDRYRTQELVNIFCKTGASVIVVDPAAELTGSNACFVQSDWDGTHSNHFHVRYPDPDEN